MQQDPAGYVDGASLYQAYESSPVARIDPDGLEVTYGAISPGNNPAQWYQPGSTMSAGRAGPRIAIGPAGGATTNDTWILKNRLGAEFAVAGDMAPGVTAEFDPIYDSPTYQAQSYLRQLELLFWEAAGLAGLQQDQDTTKYLECIEKCIDKYEGLNLLTQGALTLAGFFPRSILGLSGPGGNLGSVATLLRTAGGNFAPKLFSAKNGLLGWPLDKVANKITPKVGPVALVYNLYLAGVEVGCAITCLDDPCWE
jgi:hypothetical protein